jgi:hypothetical protein
MPSRIAATAADTPRSYQDFKNYAQVIPGKTARHKPVDNLLPEIWGFDRDLEPELVLLELPADAPIVG